MTIPGPKGRKKKAKIKKPKAPKKPAKPRKPPKEVEKQIFILHETGIDSLNMTLSEILEKAPEGAKPEDIIINMEDHGGWGDSYIIMSIYHTSMIPNPDLENQTLLYKDRLKTYNEKMIVYKGKMKEYKEKFVEYQTQELAKEKKKLEEELKKIKKELGE